MATRSPTATTAMSWSSSSLLALLISSSVIGPSLLGSLSGVESTSTKGPPLPSNAAAISAVLVTVTPDAVIGTRNTSDSIAEVLGASGPVMVVVGVAVVLQPLLSAWV